jgi:serine/threonine protein kinase
MFSVGVAAYTLLVGYEPFYGADNKELMEANKRVQYEFARRDWSHVSEAAQDFIGNCLLERADDRLTPQTALQHEWLRDAARRYREESEAMSEANLGGGCSIS